MRSAPVPVAPPCVTSSTSPPAYLFVLRDPDRLVVRDVGDRERILIDVGAGRATTGVASIDAEFAGKPHSGSGVVVERKDDLDGDGVPDYLLYVGLMGNACSAMGSYWIASPCSLNNVRVVGGFGECSNFVRTETVNGEHRWVMQEDDGTRLLVTIADGRVRVRGIVDPAIQALRDARPLLHIGVEERDGSWRVDLDGDGVDELIACSSGRHMSCTLARSNGTPIAAQDFNNLQYNSLDVLNESTFGWHDLSLDRQVRYRWNRARYVAVPAP